MDRLEIQRHSCSQEDEIDLAELLQTIWQKKYTVLCCMLVALLAAVAYLVITPSVYESKIYISPAQDADVDVLNAINNGPFGMANNTKTINSDYVFSLFARNMQSEALALHYFKQQPLRELSNNKKGVEVNELFNAFRKNFKVTKPDKHSEYLIISHQYTSAALTAEWLNNYVAYVQQQTKQQLITAVKKSMALVVDSSNKQITVMRSSYQQKLQDQILKLEEALSIAQQLGYEKPVQSGLAEKLPTNKLDESLLYMRGTKVLRAELAVLKNRKNTDAYINGIRPLQEKIQYLQSLNFENQLNNFIAIDQNASVSSKPIKPKKLLVLMLSLILGMMIGILWALIKSKLLDK